MQRRAKNDDPGRAGRWLRLSAGLALLTGFAALLATVPPPGAVLQHNTEQDIQATALFYMDLDRMPELEQKLEILIEDQSPTVR